MLVSHPRIYLDATGETTDALLVRSGRVRAVGTRARSDAAGRDAVVEPDGPCLLPALTDAHCHPWGMGRRPGTVDLADASGVEEALDRLAAADPDCAPHDWLLARNWDPRSGADRQRLSRSDLDAVGGARPVCVRRVDNHAAIVDTEALRRAGRAHWARPEGGARSPEQGRVSTDAEGTSTGRLVDAAMEPVLEAIPDRTVEEDRRTFLETARRYRRMGVSGLHLALVAADRVEMVEALFREGRLPLRSYVFVDADDDLEPLIERGPIADRRGRYACRCVKFFADGALGSQGADLLDGYADGADGVVATETDALAERAERLMRAGWQVAVHAIGDRGVRRTLEALAAAPAGARAETRPRVEHAQMLADPDLPRPASLGAVASIQPIHLRSDAVWADAVLSDEQLDRLFPWRGLARETTLAAGSDFPIEDPNPWHGIATALSRRDAAGEAFRPAKRLEREEILHAYTSGAARAAHREDRLGRLRPGYEADFILPDRDPFRADPASIWDLEVRGTWIAGDRRL